jgi:hypothetical protein
MDLVASSGFGFQEPSIFTGTPLRPPGGTPLRPPGGTPLRPPGATGFYTESSFGSDVPFLTPNLLDKGFDQEMLQFINIFDRRCNDSILLCQLYHVRFCK